MRIRAGWGILLGLMARLPVLPGLLMALLAVPLVSGCAALNLPTTADALDALPAAGVDGDEPTPGAEASPTFFSSSDGYALTLPAGWIGARTNANDSSDALDALAAADPTLADEAASIMGTTGGRMSMVGTDLAEFGAAPVPPVMAIVVISTDGRSDDETQQRLSDTIDGLTTVDGTVEHDVASVAAGDAHRYDFLVTGDQISVRLRVYLFTVGDDGVIVLFGSDPSLAAGADGDISSIIKSLRFGV